MPKIKRKIKKEVEEEVEEEIEEPKVPDTSVGDNKAVMTKQRDDYLALLKRLQDEGITNISVLENKISRLNEALK